MHNTANPMKKISIALSLAAACAFRGQAAVSEPDNVVYGLITLGGVPVTSTNTNVVISASAQLNGAAIATYQMGSLPSAGNFYSLRVPLESLLPVASPTATVSNQQVYVSVNDGTGIRAQARVIIGDRGAMLRLDLAGAVSGQTTLPSDNNPQDNSISIGETVAYLQSWRTGAAWTVAPTNIPIDYAVRTAALWRGGGTYQLNSTVGTPPAWWVNSSNTDATENASSDSAVAAMASTYTAGTPLTVSLNVAAGSVLQGYAVEDQVPAGWSVNNINNGGAFDAINHKVKWGVFFDSSARTLSYQAVPPAGAQGAVAFNGTASFDGVVSLPVGGQRAATSASSGAASFTSGLVNKNFHINLKGLQGQKFAVESSTKLLTWSTNLVITIDATGAADFFDAATKKQMFYRVVTQ